MEMYYQRRLIHLANNCIDHFISLCFCSLNSFIIPLQAIKRVDSYTFYVQRQDTQEEVYVVDMHIGSCSCKGGVDGSPCSDQAAVSKHFHIASLNSVPTLFPEKLANIALGDKAITNLSYYSSIYQKADKAVVKNTSEDIAHKLDETIAMENSFLLGEDGKHLDGEKQKVLLANLLCVKVRLLIQKLTCRVTTFQ